MAQEPCILERALDEVRPCPGPTCSFWVDDFGDGHCVFDALESELCARPGVADHLLAVRYTTSPFACEQAAAIAEPTAVAILPERKSGHE